MRIVAAIVALLLSGCASLSGTPDPTQTLIALQVIQGVANLSTGQCIPLVATPAQACTLPPGATAAQQQAVLQACFAASLLNTLIVKHQALFCPPPTTTPVPPPVVVVPAPIPVPTPVPTPTK